MSTLTICPYCGEGMRFDGMKQHLISCEGRSPFAASRSRSQNAPSPSPAKVKPVSGLEFYNHLNKLSRLTRARSGSGVGDGRTSSNSAGGLKGHVAVSPSQRDAATVRELMYPSTSLTIDVAPSRSVTSASSSSSSVFLGAAAGGESEEAHRLQRSPPLQWTASDAQASISPLVAPPPPAVRVRLDASHPSAADEESRGAVSALFVRGAEAQRSRSQGSTKPVGVSARSRSRSDVTSSGRANSTSMLTRRAGEADRSTAAHRAATSQGVQDAMGASVHSSGDVAAARLEGEARWRAGPSAASTRSSASNTSAARPVPQRSSFAIRLRGSGGSSPPEQHVGSRVDCTAGQLMPRTHGASSQDLEISVQQLRESLRCVQRLVERQQEQYNALLHAHTDVSRQVAAQQRAYDGMTRRSLDQATAMEASLQRHACQWRSEETALSDSVAALWASVSDIQQRLPQRIEGAPAEAHPALEMKPHVAASTVSSIHQESSASHRSVQMQGHAEREGFASATAAAPSIRIQRAAAAEESTYYSDIGSFLHADGPALPLPPPPPSSACMPVNSSAVTATPHDVQFASRGIFSHIPSTAAPAVMPPWLTTRGDDIAAAYSPAARRPATLPRSAPYLTDVLQPQRQEKAQQQHSRASMEDRVVAMLHAKPAVVVTHSPWK